MDGQSQLSTDELIQLCAVDSDFMYRTFFPKTVRMESAPFHHELDNILDSDERYVNVQMFRGSAKTSRLRMYGAKRVAFALSRTILCIGKSEGAAIRSIRWLKRQIEFNRSFTSVFGLRPGSKWQDHEIEIWHKTDNHPVWVLGVGLTGSLRGINFDDYRPDLILGDDMFDEENCGSDEQREKHSDLLFGAIMESLAPRTEFPNAKLALLQTPINKEDPSTLALKDQAFKSLTCGCWTKETEDLPLNERQSSWEVRYPSKELQQKKRDAAARNKLSVFIREMECKLVAPETSAFKIEWLKYFDLAPEFLPTIMVIDPVPPPSEAQMKKGFRTKDFEALTIMGRRGKDIYVLDYQQKRGHDPNWTLATFFHLATKWRPLRVHVEGVGYQRTLAWLLKQGMEHHRRWWPIEVYDDKLKKYQVITDGLNGIAANGHLFVQHEHVELIEQFRDYPDVPHDDLLETVARGAMFLQSPGFALDDNGEELDFLGEEVKALEYQRGAP